MEQTYSSRILALPEPQIAGLAISSPLMGIALLLVFVISGKVFRDNWKLQGGNWKRNCWLSGILASLCFAILAFVPFAPN
ncbi:MAG: hypothetical protein N4A65_16390 [Cohaesibacter sp.]|nr:hypothetical protein [Cohaesibacter sp.]